MEIKTLKGSIVDCLVEVIVNAVNVSKATLAARQLADKEGFVSLALPGMGTGVGGVSKEEAAKNMVLAIKGFKTQSLQTVILVDIDPERVRAWGAFL